MAALLSRANRFYSATFPFTTARYAISLSGFKRKPPPENEASPEDLRQRKYFWPALSEVFGFALLIGLLHVVVVAQRLHVERRSHRRRNGENFK